MSVYWYLFHIASLRLNVAVHYDRQFKTRFGGQAEKKIKQVMAVVDNMYSERKTLTTTIDVHVMGIKHEAQESWGSTSSANLYVHTVLVLVAYYL